MTDSMGELGFQILKGIDDSGLKMLNEMAGPSHSVTIEGVNGGAPMDMDKSSTAFAVTWKQSCDATTASLTTSTEANQKKQSQEIISSLRG